MEEKVKGPAGDRKERSPCMKEKERFCNGEREGEATREGRGGRAVEDWERKGSVKYRGKELSL